MYSSSYRLFSLSAIVCLCALLCISPSDQHPVPTLPGPSPSPTQPTPPLPTPTPADPSLTARTIATQKLQQFQQILIQLRQQGKDADPYQDLFNKDKYAFDTAQSLHDLNQLVTQIDTDLSTHLPLAQQWAHLLVEQFHQAVSAWNNTHLYHDNYDGKDYPLAYEYAILPDNYGAGADLDTALQAATTLPDYQAVLTQVSQDQILFQALQDNAQDTTPWNQPHTTDLRLIQSAHATTGQVIVVSFYEQTLRLYQDGQLTQSYQVVTGLYQRPTPPGYWRIRSHADQAQFTSFETPDSPFYFPPTLIHWVMGFDDPGLGYFIHASPWRTYYGQNNNFPHDDPHNDNTESRNGSHGCVNLPMDHADWLYHHVNDGTTLIIY